MAASGAKYLWIMATMLAGMLSHTGALSYLVPRLARPRLTALNSISTDAGVNTAQLTEMPPLEELQRILSVAETAARKAGVLIRENIGARVKYSKTNYKVRVTSLMACESIRF